MKPGLVASLVAALLVTGCTDDSAPTSEPPPGDATSPAPSSTPSAKPPAKPPTITLTLVGDIMLVRHVPDPAAALEPLRKRLGAADITIGNLESTLSLNGEPQQPNDDSFGGTPALLQPLGRAGFDALSLGNNHTGDYGSTALVETIRAFDGSRIESFGAGEGLREASRPAIIAVDGVRFAFVAFNAIGETPQAAPGQPGALSIRMPPRTGPLNTGDLDHVAGVVRQAKEDADVVVVVPHWGGNYTRTVDPAQRMVARRLVAAGADLIVGGHSHWVQGSEEIRGVPAFYSLGNFIFDMRFMPETMEGVFLETTWRGDRLVRAEPVAFRLDPVSFAPRVVRGAVAAGILDDVSRPAAAP